MFSNDGRWQKCLLSGEGEKGGGRHGRAQAVKYDKVFQFKESLTIPHICDFKSLSRIKVHPKTAPVPPFTLSFDITQQQIRNFLLSLNTGYFSFAYSSDVHFCKS